MPIKDIEARRRYHREWVAGRRAEFFRDKVCVICGSDDRLELDHIDPALKVSHNIWSWSASRRDVEIAKCQILCHDCHKEKTIQQQPITNGWVPYRHGTASMYRHGCKCGLCMLYVRNRKRASRARTKV